MSSTHEPPPATIGDVAELLDVDVQQVPRVVVLVAAYRFAGGPVQTREPVQAARDQDPVRGLGRDADVRGELDWTQSLA